MDVDFIIGRVRRSAAPGQGAPQDHDNCGEHLHSFLISVSSCLNYKARPVGKLRVRRLTDNPLLGPTRFGWQRPGNPANKTESGKRQRRERRWPSIEVESSRTESVLR